jgi:hypothetical protein
LAPSDNPQRETWIELGLNVLLPTLVLIFLSPDDRLGAKWALVVGLSFPLVHVLRSRLLGADISPLSVLAVPSVLITGGIGLFELDPQWFQVKEAIMPLILAAAVYGSTYTSYPIMDTLLFRMIDIDKVNSLLAEKGRGDALEPSLRMVNWAFMAGFFYSAVASYFLAGYLVTSPTGSPEFTAELGQFTFISFPVVALPMTVLMGFALNKMMNDLEDATGHELDDLLRPGLASAKKADTSSQP